MMVHYQADGKNLPQVFACGAAAEGPVAGVYPIQPSLVTCEDCKRKFPSLWPELRETGPETKFVGADGGIPCGLTTTWQPRTEPLVTISEGGKVTLAADLDLAQVKSLGRVYLLALREIVNTALYDLETGK